MNERSLTGQELAGARATASSPACVPWPRQMSRTHSSTTGRAYMTCDPEEVHDRLWAGWRGEMAWDVGANWGQSVDCLVPKFTRVLAFEPAAESFAVLASDWGSHPQVQLFDCAVGDHVGTMELSVAQHAIAGGQLLAPEAMGANGPGDSWFTGEAGRRAVPCSTLDVLSSEHGVPDFVKIDTEGGEGKVLAGGKGLVSLRATSWLVEFHTAALRVTCQEAFAGYQVELVRNPYFTGPPENDWNGWLRVTP